MKEMIGTCKRMAQDFINAKDQLEYLKALAVLSVPKQNLLTCYTIFCRDKKIPTIEDLNPFEKQKTWDTAKEIADGKLNTVDEVKDLCRCLITLEYLLTL